jgi:hypothetical protein
MKTYVHLYVAFLIVLRIRNVLDKRLGNVKTHVLLFNDLFPQKIVLLLDKLEK